MGILECELELKEKGDCFICLRGFFGFSYFQGFIFLIKGIRFCFLCFLKNRVLIFQFKIFWVQEEDGERKKGGFGFLEVEGIFGEEVWREVWRVKGVEES